jgi:hypothetical protein
LFEHLFDTSATIRYNKTMDRWMEIDKEVADVCGVLNVAHARLVDLVAEVLVNDSWSGHGVNSPEFWVTWKTGMTPTRAKTIVEMARRRIELPVTFTAFATGELAVDQVAVIAKFTPSHNDAEMCDLARSASVTQLRKVGREYSWQQPVVPPKPPAEPKPTADPDGDWDDDSDEDVRCETGWSPDCWCQDECTCAPQCRDQPDDASSRAAEEHPLTDDGAQAENWAEGLSADDVQKRENASEAGRPAAEELGDRSGNLHAGGSEHWFDCQSEGVSGCRNEGYGCTHGGQEAATAASGEQVPVDDEVTFWFDDDRRFHLTVNLSTDLGVLTEASLTDVQRGRPRRHVGEGVHGTHRAVGHCRQVRRRKRTVPGVFTRGRQWFMGQPGASASSVGHRPHHL